MIDTPSGPIPITGEADDQLALSTTEAAWVTGMSAKTILRLIERGEVRPSVTAGKPRPRTRQGHLFGTAELLYLALRPEMEPVLTNRGRTELYNRLLGWPQSWRSLRQPPEHEVRVGLLEIDLTGTLETLWRRLVSLLRVRACIIRDPEIRTGEPVVRGTRVPVAVLADLTKQGASADELLEDYPSVSKEALEAALEYAKLYPKRGRPRSTPPWRGHPTSTKAASARGRSRSKR